MTINQVIANLTAHNVNTKTINLIERLYKLDNRSRIEIEAAEYDALDELFLAAEIKFKGLSISTRKPDDVLYVTYEILDRQFELEDRNSFLDGEKFGDYPVSRIA